MNYNEFKEKIVQETARQGISQYELYYESGSSTMISAFAGEINEFSSSTEGGICLRLVADGKMGYASTEALTEEEAIRLVEHAIDNARSLEIDDPIFLGEGGKTYQVQETKDYTIPSTEKMIDVVLTAQKMVVEADETTTPNSGARVSAGNTTIAISNSNGLDLSYSKNVSMVMAMAVASNGQEMTDAYELKTGDLAALDIPALADQAAKSAKNKLGAQVAPTAVCPVIFSSDAMASLLSTYSGIFSSENAQKGLSLLKDKEETQIGSPAVTLVDDPFYKDSTMPIHFDAEGTPSYCKNVIEKGVLKTLLYNLTTAALAGKETTGNAAKAGYNSSIGISPFTFYLAPGTLTEEELIEKAGNGVYINSLGGLHAGANVISGDFSLQSAGFMIENGKKTIPVKSFTVAGNFYDVLKKITDVSDTVEIPFPGGITAYGSPAVLVSSLSIAGK